jgi:hypothetical protein
MIRLNRIRLPLGRIRLRRLAAGVAMGAASPRQWWLPALERGF